MFGVLQETEVDATSAFIKWTLSARRPSPPLPPLHNPRIFWEGMLGCGCKNKQ